MRTFVLALVLAACGGGSKKPAEKPAEPIANTAPAAAPAAAPQTPKERAMAKMHEFEAAICACHDSTCANRVMEDMTAYSREQAAHPQEPVKLTEAEQREMTDVGMRMGECMQAAMSAGSGAPP